MLVITIHSSHFEPHIRRKSHARSWQWWIIFFGMLTPSLTRNVPSWRNWSPLLFSADFEQTRAHDSDTTKGNACILFPILWSWPPTTSWSPDLVLGLDNGLGVREQRTQKKIRRRWVLLRWNETTYQFLAHCSVCAWWLSGCSRTHARNQSKSSLQMQKKGCIALQNNTLGNPKIITSYLLVY